MKFKTSLKAARWPSIEKFDDSNYACEAWKSTFIEVIDKACPLLNLETKKAKLMDDLDIWLSYRRKCNLLTKEIKKTIFLE